MGDRYSQTCLRCRHKNQFQQDLQKIIDTLSIYKQECKYISKRCTSFWGVFDDMVKDLQLNRQERNILDNVLCIYQPSYTEHYHINAVSLIKNYIEHGKEK